VLDLGRHAILAELEGGNAVDQQAAGEGIGVVDGHGVALAPQALGGGQPGRPAAHNRHTFAGIGGDCAARDALGGDLVIGHELLDLANAHRLAAGAAAMRARSLAQPFLGADTGADLRHRAGLAEDVGRLNEPAFFYKAEDGGDVVSQRACELAGRWIGALDAAPGFDAGDLRFVVEVNLSKMLKTPAGVLLDDGLHVLVGARLAIYIEVGSLICHKLLVLREGGCPVTICPISFNYILLLQ